MSETADNPPEYATILHSALDAAQNELIEAETSLLEVVAKAEKARNEVSRLKAAVAALSGESPPATNNYTEPRRKAEAQDTPFIEDPDEWEQERERKMRKREKARKEEDRANNPLYDVKCTGCGQSGVLQKSMIQAPSGVPLQCTVCKSCGNQTFA